MKALCMNFLLAGAAASLVVVVSAFEASPASALTAKACSARYDAAKAAGTLAGVDYSTFRRTTCGANEDSAPPMQVAAATAPTAATGPVFPSAISPQHASEPAGAARRHTCSDQFKSNRATNANGGLKWLQKGGGYYSQCNKRLKGS
jgi:hypothetical protein